MGPVHDKTSIFINPAKTEQNQSASSPKAQQSSKTTQACVYKLLPHKNPSHIQGDCKAPQMTAQTEELKKSFGEVVKQAISNLVKRFSDDPLKKALKNPNTDWSHKGLKANQTLVGSINKLVQKQKDWSYEGVYKNKSLFAVLNKYAENHNAGDSTHFIQNYKAMDRLSDPVKFQQELKTIIAKHLAEIDEFGMPKEPVEGIVSEPVNLTEEVRKTHVKNLLKYRDAKDFNKEQMQEAKDLLKKCVDGMCTHQRFFDGIVHNFKKHFAKAAG